MARIDFPTYGDTHISYDETGAATNWKKERNSWVKQFDWSIESPAGFPSREYCKKDQVWSEIKYPIPTDVDLEDDANGLYARSSSAGVKSWELLQVNMGPVFDKNDGLLYAVRDGAWDLVPGDELFTNYYDKTTSDARYASSQHTHVLAEDITGQGSLAYENDIVEADKQFIRKIVDGIATWEELVLPSVPKHTKAITIIDPQKQDDALIFRTPSPITLSSVHAAVPKGGSIVFNLFFSPTADGSSGGITAVFNADKTIVARTGQAIVADTAVIPANSWVWVGIPDNTTPTAGMFHVSLGYN